MHQYELQGSPYTTPRFRYFASLRVLATACFMMHAVGCVHQSANQAPSAPKSPTVEKQASPSAAQPSRMEQSDKSKTIEKKSSIQKEKRSTASAEKNPGKKPEQPEEQSPEVFTPPPPLKPPTFGGAGG